MHRSPWLVLLWISSANAHPGADAHLSATADSPCEQPEIAVRRAQALLEEGRLDESDNELVRAAACGVPLRLLRLPQAEIALRRSEPQAALPLIDSALLEEPTSTGALLLRAQALHALDRSDEAATDALSVARHEKTPEPWLIAAAYAPEPGRRVQILDEALSVHEGLPVLVHAAANAQHEAGLLDRALATLASLPTSANSLALAADWSAPSRPDHARDSYQKALALASAGRSTPHQRALITHIETALEALQ